MLFGDVSGPLRKWQDEARKRREADAPARALRLSSATVLHWTRVLEKAAPLVGPGKRPCDYGPWSKAITEAMGRIAPLDLMTDPYAHHHVASDFRGFMEDVALPAWPEPRRDLVEFALVFLEADVMLFRSGYAKRHLIARLKAAPLTGADTARIAPMLRRAVTDGTGLEEFRAWGKLAAHLVDQGHLGDLPVWLCERAEGAILTLRMADAPLMYEMLRDDRPEADIKLLSQGAWYGPARFGFAWPDMVRVVPAGDLTQTHDQRVKRNAWRMLDQILRRIPGLKKDLSVHPGSST